MKKSAKTCFCSDHDKKHINKEIEKIGGIDRLNANVRSGLVDAFKNGIEEKKKLNKIEASCKLRGCLGNILLEHGEYLNAVNVLDEAIRGIEDLSEGKHATMSLTTTFEVAEWYLVKGLALSELGRHDEGIQCMLQVWCVLYACM